MPLADPTILELIEANVPDLYDLLSSYISVYKAEVQEAYEEYLPAEASYTFKHKMFIAYAIVLKMIIVSIDKYRQELETLRVVDGFSATTKRDKIKWIQMLYDKFYDELTDIGNEIGIELSTDSTPPVGFVKSYEFEEGTEVDVYYD